MIKVDYCNIYTINSEETYINNVVLLLTEAVK